MRIWETLHQSDLPSTNWWSPNTVALVVKRLPADVGDLRDAGSIPGSGRCPGGGYCNSLQYSCLEKSMDRGAWRAMVHRVSSSRSRRKRLSTAAFALKSSCDGDWRIHRAKSVHYLATEEGQSTLDCSLQRNSATLVSSFPAV